MPIQMELKVTSGKPIYRGHDHYWSVIKDLGKDNKLFTRHEVALRSNDRDDYSVADYIKRLHAAGFLEMIEQRLQVNRGAGNSVYNVYRLIKRQALAPVVNRDGTLGKQGLAQLQIWNAMRALPGFSLVELAVTASTPDVEILRETAKRYVTHLNRAGYLLVLRESSNRVQGMWRLKPSMNTGPNPPKILKTKLVYDPNRKEIMGAPLAEKCAK